MTLSSEELKRYDQQIKLLQIGTSGQLKLKNARVLCVGTGGLGSALTFYLAAAGVGTIGLIDPDQVDLSNLHRQILFTTTDVGCDKTIAAKKTLHALNQHIDIHTYTEKLNTDNANTLIRQYDIIADCCDNFTTRYLINDTCYHLNKPYVFASVGSFAGQCSLFAGRETPCFRCIFPQDDIQKNIPTCHEGGVLGVLPGLLGVIQATEIIKWITQYRDTLKGYLLIIDILKMNFKKIIISKNPHCPLS